MWIVHVILILCDLISAFLRTVFDLPCRFVAIPADLLDTDIEEPVLGGLEDVESDTGGTGAESGAEYGTVEYEDSFKSKKTRSRSRGEPRRSLSDGLVTAPPCTLLAAAPVAAPGG